MRRGKIVLWHRTVKTIIAQWQADAAYSLEAGEKPLFNLGHSNASLDGLLGLASLQKMIAMRESIVQPVVAMGGHSALWIFALLQRTPKQSDIQSSTSAAYGNQMDSHSKEPKIVFTGADQATQIATVATQTSTYGVSTPLGSAMPVSPKERWTGLSASIRYLFAPTSEPSTITPVESLPFSTEPIRMQHDIAQYAQANATARRSNSGRPMPDQQEESTSVDEQTIWTARAMIGLAILMMLTALFV